MNDRKLPKSGSEFHLATDLWPDILSRLPVKSLLRFRCVSKSWLALINDPEFTRLHLKNFKNNRVEANLLVVQATERSCVVRCSKTFKVNETTPFALEPGCGIQSWQVEFCVDGLVLLKSWQPIHTRHCRLKVWNPSIRKFHDFPPLPEIKIFRGKTLSQFELGLGYDPLINDYKHVKLIFLDNRGPPLIAIYTLGADSWKFIQFQGKGCSEWHWRGLPYRMGMRRIYFEGSLYVIARDLSSNALEVVLIDLSSEVFSSIRLPEFPYLDGALILVDGGSSLALYSQEDLVSSLWVLGSSGGESESLCWTRRYSFSAVPGEFMYVKKNGDLLCRWRLPMMSTTINYDNILENELVILYNYETVEILAIQPNVEQIDNYICEVRGYVESLIMLK